MTFEEGKQKIRSAVDFLHTEVSKIKTGRATPDLLTGIEVEVYETMMPISHIATISVPDHRTISIQLWDKENVAAVEKAIQKSDIGMTPNVDGQLIRLRVPALTQELREEYVKQMKSKVEEVRVSIRQIRQKMMEEVEDSVEEGGVSEDDVKRQKNLIEKEISAVMEEIDKFAQDKESELMSV